MMLGNVWIYDLIYEIPLILGSFIETGYSLEYISDRSVLHLWCDVKDLLFSYLFCLKSYGMAIVPKCILHPKTDSKYLHMYDITIVSFECIW